MASGMDRQGFQKSQKVAKPHKIKAVWVRGHNGHPENERCDELARKTAEQFKKEQE